MGTRSFLHPANRASAVTQVAYTPTPLVATLAGLGVTGFGTNKGFVLDAGDPASFPAPGTGTSWLDTGGGGYDFFRGATSSATTDDPTFNGTPGGLSSSEYWTVDGGDQFRYDSTNEGFMDALHQAGVVFTFMLLVYPGTAAQFSCLGSSQNNTSNIGVFLTANSSNGAMAAIVHNASGSQAFNYTSSSRGVTAGEWQLLTFRIDQVTPRNCASRNASHGSVGTGLYSAPSALAATYALEIGASGNGGSKLPSGGRIAAAALLNEYLSDHQIERTWDALRARFGV